MSWPEGFSLYGVGVMSARMKGEKKSLLPSFPHSLSLVEGRGVSSHLGGRTKGREGTE